MTGQFGKRLRQALFAFAILAALVTALSWLCIEPLELERGHFSAFYQAFFHDGDLNIINHVPLNDRWLVTRTYNHPTHVNHGVLLFWFPFYAYVDAALGALTPRVLDLDAYQVAGVIRNALFLLLGGLFLGRAIGQATKSSGHARGRMFGATAIMLAATPLLLYGIFEPFSSETTLFFLGSLLTFEHLAHPPRAQSLARLFATGAFIGVGIVTKDSLFAFLLSAGADAALSERARGPRLTALFAGAALPVGLLTINNAVQFGELVPSPHWTISGLAGGAYALLWPHLFGSPNSFFLSSPIVLVALALALSRIARAIRQRPDPLSTLAFAVAGLGVLVAWRVGPIFTYLDLIASRTFMPILPAGVVLILVAWERSTSRARLALGVALAISTVVNLTHIGELTTRGMVWESWMSPGLIAAFLVKVAGLVAAKRGAWASLTLLAAYTPLILAGACALTWAFRATDRRRGASGPFPAFALGLLSLYAVVTAVNAYRNPREAQELLAQGFFRESVVSSGSTLDYYDEVTALFEDGMHYLPPPAADAARERYASYLDAATRDALVDPVGFVSSWKAGHPRPSLWNAESH